MFNFIIKYFKSNKFNNILNLLKSSSILSIPSILGVMLALIAIPIHLQINGKSDYGNYIFFHFVISLGLLFNFGINKIVAIEVSKKKFINQIIVQSLKISLKIIVLILSISLLVALFFKNFQFLVIIIIGLSLTIIYLNLEGILQGFKNFKLLAISNFLFYTLSLNIPSILLLFNNSYDFYNLIWLSITFKFLTVCFLFIFFRKFLNNKNFEKKYNFFLKFKKYSKWYFLHFLNMQIFDIADKYLIKIFIGPIALAIYSIPYQLAGKITIISKSLSAVLLPEISSGKGKNSFNYSLKFFVFFVPIFILIIFPFLNDLLNLWLKDQNSNNILNLTKIFLIISWISGISHLLIVYFEGTQKIKINTQLELYLIIPFLFLMLYIILKYNNLIYVSLVLLFKEFVLLIFRTRKIKSEINSITIIYLSIIMVIFNLLISLYIDQYFIYSFTTLIGISLLIFQKKK